MTVGEFLRQVDDVQEVLEAEFEDSCARRDLEPLAYAQAAGQVAAVVFGHAHRARGTGDQPFAQAVADFAERFVQEARRHRTMCAEDGAAVPLLSAESQLLH
ncbi:MAG TPA: hypothetical protein VGR82_17480 [Methylomirabilota bacterium]|nr:hypothetical protein [Methylomirabilota bacterium]